MLKGDGNENDLISKKKKIASAAHFFFELAKRQIYTCSTHFCSFFAVVLLHYNAVLYD